MNYVLGGLVIALWWSPALVVAYLAWQAVHRSDPAPDPVFDELEEAWSLPAFDPHGA